MNVFQDYYKNLLDKCNSVFFNCFNYIFEKKMICASKHVTLKFQNFLSYEFDIQKIVEKFEINNNNNPMKPKYELNILDCIKCTKNINQQQFNVYCEKCKKKTQISQDNSIYISPNYLC